MQSGQGTPADMQQYQAWAMQEMPKYMAEIDPAVRRRVGLPTAQPPRKKSKRKPNKAQRAAQQKRLDELRPTLGPGVTDEQVQDVLDRRAVFAEEVLAEFLPLLGIPDFYANLSYRYLDESSPEELA